jgi:hypothetical protein
MRQINKTIFYAGVVLTILVGLFIILPCLFLGPPSTNLVEIYNNDNEKHTITVEIIDQHNGLIYEESWELYPEDSITETKALWFMFKSFLPLNDRSIIKATLEDGKSTTYDTSMGPWETVIISIQDCMEDHENAEIFIFSEVV